MEGKILTRIMQKKLSVILIKWLVQLWFTITKDFVLEDLKRLSWISTSLKVFKAQYKRYCILEQR